MRDEYDGSGGGGSRRSGSGVRENDLVLNPHEYCFVQDTNSGFVATVVGPKKETLQNTDSPMLYNPSSREYEKTTGLAKATRKFSHAEESSYIILRNPAIDAVHPQIGQVNKAVELDYGREVNVPGPIAFALWPGQEAIVREGHRLRSNQYLLVRVINTKVAEENLGEQVATDETGKKAKISDFKLATGALNVIKGTEVSFYIPPTGIEVVPDEGDFVRDALTLERLQYCVLVDEGGDRRYERGPAVVFPEPTEVFERSDALPGKSATSRHATGKGSRSFKAIELNENMGIYVKVTSDYKDEEGKEHQAGDELFITGKEQKIYFPRAEHVTIKYDDKFMHYAIAVPPGRAIYVLDKLKGSVDTIEGPNMFLPDPRTQVVVKRVLEKKQVSMWFPGNEEAEEYNKGLRGKAGGDGYIQETRTRMVEADSGVMTGVRAMAISSGFMGDKPEAETFVDGLSRKSSYTPPRSIQLDTKYIGAIVVCVWSGYCIQVIKGNGDRRVVEGPTTVILDYDETLEVLKMSSGTPKDDRKTIQTAYLRTKNNLCSDVVKAVTKDLVDVSVKLSYKINFVDTGKAFDVDDYIKFFTQACRSIIRNSVKKVGIQEFIDTAEDAIRDLILGAKVEGKDRDGRSFPENGMHIYDVDVLDITVGDAEIEDMIIQSQHETVSTTLELSTRTRKVAAVEKLEELSQKEILLIEATDIVRDKLKSNVTSRNAAIELLILESEQALTVTQEELAIARRKITDDDAESLQKHSQVMLAMEIDAFQKKFGAINDKLIVALQSMADSQVVQSLADNLPDASGTFGFLSGRGGAEGLMNLVAGSPLEEKLKAVMGECKKQITEETH
jgi:major vault protein